MSRLLGLVRTGVALASKITTDGKLQSTISFERATGDSGSEKTFTEGAVPLKAIVVDTQEVVRTFTGELSQAKTRILFTDIKALLAATSNLGIKEQDRITLQNGDSGPILSVGGFIDSGTGIPVATKVYLG